MADFVDYGTFIRFDGFSRFLKNSPEFNTEPIAMKIAENLAWVLTIRWQLEFPTKDHYWRKKSTNYWFSSNKYWPKLGEGDVGEPRGCRKWTPRTRIGLEWVNLAFSPVICHFPGGPVVVICAVLIMTERAFYIEVLRASNLSARSVLVSDSGFWAGFGPHVGPNILGIFIILHFRVTPRGRVRCAFPYSGIICIKPWNYKYGNILAIN